MNSAFARASRPLASAARNLTDAGLSPGSVSARPVSRQLRPSQQPTGAPVQGVVMPPGGSSAGLRPSQGVLLREGDGGAKLRIQRCGIGSSCDCPARDKLTGIEHDLQRATAAGGRPLPPTSREHMENAFSFDFAAVRVHTGAAAHNAASALGARALTTGTDILFRADEYQPGTQGGDRLLAHELAHVVQQAHGLPQGILDTGATDHLERAAIPEAGTQSNASTPHSPTDAGLRGGVGASPPAAGGSPRTVGNQAVSRLMNGVRTVQRSGPAAQTAGPTAPKALTAAQLATAQAAMTDLSDNALEQLQRALGVLASGGYDEVTANAVYARQQSFGG